ncbi:MAG: response regulator [Planctomycetes bacterium]|nr:response regulator [Planctomycetota bacterium]
MNEIVLIHDLQSSPAPRRAVLERAGWHVRATHDAREALGWIRSAPPALVLVDVCVEGGTGFDVCRALRAEFEPARLPVVLGCHLYHGPEYEAEARAAGAQGYLELPTEVDALVRCVTDLAGTAGETRAA